jgi:hypothetical protein
MAITIKQLKILTNFILSVSMIEAKVLVKLRSTIANPNLQKEICTESFFYRIFTGVKDSLKKGCLIEIVI